MPKLDITTLEKGLRLGERASAYIIVGPESLLRERAITLIKEKWLGPNPDSFGTTSFSAGEAKVPEISLALRTVPFLSPKTLVLIRDAERLTEDVSAVICEFIEKPVETSIIVVAAEKMDGRSRLSQLAAKRAAVVECKPLYADKIPAWINMEARRAGKQISIEAARFMADMVGSDLSQISQAIERLTLFVGVRPAITLEDIELAIAETHQRTVFELTDAVGERKLSKAISLLHNIMDNGCAPVLAVNMIVRHLRILMKAKDIAGRITDRGEIAKYLGVHPYYAMNYLSQSKNFSGGELKNGFKVFHRCDRSVKSSRVPRERIIERALVEFIKA